MDEMFLLVSVERDNLDYRIVQVFPVGGLVSGNSLVHQPHLMDSLCKAKYLTLFTDPSSRK